MGHGGLPRTADVVVVGAGSAGCVLAERLSRDPARSVLLLERGPARWPSDAVRDLRTLPITADSGYAVQHPEATGLGVVRGSGFGGSSAVNGGYFLRWHPDDFADWPTGWGLDEVTTAYDELDRPGGTMGVSAFGDDELSDAARRFEDYWGQWMPIRPPDDPWPIVGVNRVRSNRAGMLRMTAAEAYLRPAARRPNLVIRAAEQVDAVVASGRIVSGVRLGDDVVDCGEVVLCAGTLGTAAILLRSGLDTAIGGDVLTVAEHREVLVHYRTRASGSRTALLQSVVHTQDDLEIRCYSADLADYIDGLVPVGPAVGVAAMRPGTPGTVRLGATGAEVDLGAVAADVADRMANGVAAVVEMLGSSEFGDLVDERSVTVDPVIRTSQHAWGSMPMGSRTDPQGAVEGVRGLRIVDGSILPAPGRSGPHATVMMAACRIGDLLTSAR